MVEAIQNRDREAVYRWLEQLEAECPDRQQRTYLVHQYLRGLANPEDLGWFAKEFGTWLERHTYDVKI